MRSKAALTTATKPQCKLALARYTAIAAWLQLVCAAFEL